MRHSGGWGRFWAVIRWVARVVCSIRVQPDDEPKKVLKKRAAGLASIGSGCAIVYLLAEELLRKVLDLLLNGGMIGPSS